MEVKPPKDDYGMIKVFAVYAPMNVNVSAKIYTLLWQPDDHYHSRSHGAGTLTTLHHMAGNC